MNDKTIYAILLTVIVLLSHHVWSQQNTIDNLVLANNQLVDELSSDMGIIDETSDETIYGHEIVPVFVSTEKRLKKKHGLQNIEAHQLQKLLTIYEKAKDTDYAMTLVSIAWKESRGSSWPVNLQDPSCGPFHNKVKNVIIREELEDTDLMRNIVCGRLINDLDFAIKHAILELEVWDRTHDGKWRNMLASYNGGHKGNKVYAEEVVEIYNTFRNSNLKELSGDYL